MNSGSNEVKFAICLLVSNETNKYIEMNSEEKFIKEMGFGENNAITTLRRYKSGTVPKSKKLRERFAKITGINADDLDPKKVEMKWEDFSKGDTQRAQEVKELLELMGTWSDSEVHSKLIFAKELDKYNLRKIAFDYKKIFEDEN